MRNLKKITLLATVGSLLFMMGHLTGISAKELPKGPISSKELKEIKKPPGVRIPGCTDLKATLTIRKRAVGEMGIIELYGKICNVGTMDYNSSRGATAQLVGIDPVTGAVRLQSKSLFFRLPKGKCKDIKKTYTIERFIEWGHTIPVSGQCRGQIKFELSVAPAGAQGTGFPKAEDCRSDNNSVTEYVKFMCMCP